MFGGMVEGNGRKAVHYGVVLNSPDTVKSPGNREGPEMVACWYREYVLNRAKVGMLLRKGGSFS